MEKITLVEYCRIHGKDPSRARRKCIKGDFKSAEKIGRDWFIDQNEPWIDRRIKSGKYVDWRKNTNDK